MKITVVAILIAVSIAGKDGPNIPYNLPIPTIANGYAKVLASSEYDANHAVSHIALDYVTRPGIGASAWAAGFLNANQYVLVHFGQKPVRIVSLVTQGRADFDQWITSFRLQYSQDGIYWSDVENGTVYTGNVDRNTKATKVFSQAIYARVLKFIPVTWNGHISTRLEVYIDDN